MIKFNKHILEAINRGIQLALDDFEDDNELSSKSNIVKNASYIKKRLKFEQLTERFFRVFDRSLNIEWMEKRGLHVVPNDSEEDITSKDLKNIAKLSKDLDLKYKIKNKTGYLKDLIRFVIVRDPRADLNWLDVSNITWMRDLFKGSTFNGDISEWDVSNVTDMQMMFYESPFNGDISKWDVSKVKNMLSMFEFSKFNQPIGNWDVSNVTTMASMFANSPFNQYIGDWNLSSLESSIYMFHFAQNFNQDISKWDVSHIKNFTFMFRSAKAFNQDISNWNISPTANTYNMFWGCYINEDFIPPIVKEAGKYYRGKFNDGTIMESINRGIQLALDDDDDDIIAPIETKNNIIKNNNDIIKNRLEYADLGLPSGTLWARYNFGVDPSKLRFAKNWYGNYYMWGEFIQKKQKETYRFNWREYRFSSGGKYDELTKYNYEDRKCKLDDRDDVVFLKTHGKYKMPTYEQMLELIKETAFHWVEGYQGVRGLRGILFESLVNNEEIFIPAGGADYNLEEKGMVYIWSKTRCSDEKVRAKALTTDENKNRAFIKSQPRAMIMPIRPVLNQK